MCISGKRTVIQVMLLSVTVLSAFAVFFQFQILCICVSVKEGRIVALPEQM